MSRDSSSRFAHRPLHELFEAQAERTPDRVAVVCDGRELSYHALNERANRLAHRLRAMGIGPEQLVALYLERSLDLVAGILGVLKAGAAYVPLDLESPPDRLAFFLQDAAPAAVVAHAQLRDRLPHDQPALIVADPGGPWFDGEAVTNPDVGATPSSLAYVIYTSGSTGTPKGALIEHGSVVSLLRASEQLFRFGGDDVWTLFHSAAFDFSVWELWGALLYGARLVVVPREVARSAEECYALCVRECVTVLNQTPSAFQPFIEADRAWPADRGSLSLKYVIFGGEALAAPMLRSWLIAHGDDDPQLINMYGITETTVHVTSRRIRRADLESTGESRSLIGAPIPGYLIRLLEPHSRAASDELVSGEALDVPLKAVAAGEAGEIAVGGVGLARGYLNRPELTAERFVRDTLDSDPGARLYRSGDLGRVLPNGDLEDLGRIDQQVKIRGFRVELGEIEAVLGRHAAVAQSAVVVREEGSDDKRVVAYWSRRPAAGGTSSDLRAYARSKLPNYMVPSVFVELAHLPVTVNGKLDRRALSTVAPVGADGDSAGEGPRDSTEERLTAIWSEVLGLHRVGIHDDFFEIGGHSLLAMQVATRISAQLGVRVPISQIFERPTVALLATVVRALQSGPVEPVEGGSPVSAPEDRCSAPMSFAQRGLWFVAQLTGQRSAYLLPEAWRLRGPLDCAALESALTTLVRRHAALRTRFDLDNGEPIQIVEESRPVPVAEHDLRGLPGTEQEAAVERLLAEEADRPFDLRVGLLLRARLLILADDEHVLLLTVHHIASDAWSRSILLCELERFYRAFRRGESPALATPAIDYRTFARRQRAALTPARELELLTYWRRQLAEPTRLELPADGARPLTASDRGRQLRFDIPRALLDGLQRLASNCHVTLQILLAAAYQALLARDCGQEDIAIATFAAGRDSTDVEDLVGVFVNQIVLRTDLSRRPTFRECLARVRAVSLEAYDHQDLPFERLVAELHPDRRPGENPLARVAFQFLTFEGSPPALDGLDVVCLPTPDGRARFDLEMTISVAPVGLCGVLVYRTDVFSHERIAQLAASYQTVLEAAATSPDRPIDELMALTPAEREQQLAQWSGVGRASTEIACLHVRFAAQAAETPDAPAVSFGAASLTYQELNDSADRLARRLCDLGVVPDQVIALHLDRSAELVVSMLAVLKAGAAYMPLDAASPAERLAFMMREQQVDILIADRPVPASLASVVKHVLVVPDLRTPSPIAGGGMTASGVQPSNLAYVMYTSGSTGQPKGVGVPHQAVARLVRQTDYIQIETTDRIAQASNASFDASTFEIWGALLNGAQLVGVERSDLLSPVRLEHVIRDRGITVLFLTTALFHELAEVAPAMFAPLSCLLVGGEVLAPGAVRAVRAAGGPRRFLHVYGPTENTTFSTSFEITAAFGDGDFVPIGRPIAGSTCFVLDPQRALLPAGAAGELYLGGTGLATGYVRRPELTADRFVPHPFRSGERFYRTGDRVRWCADGVLEFLGRLDRQIKLRGHRIELEEIESTLSKHPAVGACAVVLRDERPGDKQLVAYWVPRRSVPPASDALREHLRRHLPDYMVPAAFVQVPSLPLTAHGKLDRASLPGPDITHATGPGEPAGGPATPLEATLTEVFRDVLELAHLNPRDTFFDLGGTSLMVFRLIDRINRRCGRDVSVTDVLSHPSVAELASLLEAGDVVRACSSSSIVVIRRGGAQPPLYFPPGLMGDVLVDDAIVGALPQNQPVYALSHPVSAVLAPSLEAMAERFCDQVCAFQPHGTFSLAGYSFGGLLAYEMACQLQRRGRHVAMVAVFDTGPNHQTERSATGTVIAVLRFLENLPRWIGEDLVRTFDRNRPARLVRSLKGPLRRIGHWTGPSAPDETHSRAEDEFDTSQWPPALYAHVENNLRILDSFRYGPYAGAVVVFRARVRPLFKDHARDLGWGTLASDVQVIDVPGNHHTMMLDPNIRVVARALRSALDTRSRRAEERVI